MDGDIHEFGAGSAIVSVPYTLGNGESAETIKVYYFDVSGELIDMNATYENGCLVFTTDHFSEYVVKNVPIAIPSGNDSVFGIAIFMIAGILALIIIAVGVHFCRTKTVQ